MARLKLAGDEAGELSGVQIMKDLMYHIKTFESDIGKPVSYTDVIFSLLCLSVTAMIIA